jgi:hypothetical protein
MFMQLVGRTKCAFGIHRRSRGRTVFRKDGSVTSVCRYCRTPMKNTLSGWVTDTL